MELVISMNTNIPEYPSIEFTSDIYYIPNEKKKEEKEEDIKYNKYPFFTNEIRFPESQLKNKSQLQLKRIFFIKDEFEDFIKVPTATEESEKQDNTNYNLKLFMELLMPTSFPKIRNYHISYDEKIKKVANYFGQTRTLQSAFIGPDKKFSYIKKKE